ncbi:MAG: agmatinase [Chlorobi bacterium]|nr:agmatinase [Chlorobiota bacterium]
MKIVPEEKNFLGLPEEFSNYENSKIAILSAPLEKTVSYGGGTAKGPEEILSASHYVEFYDEEIKREICFEKGIATLEPLQLKDKSSEEALDVIYANVKKLLGNDKFVVTLGGEHTISLAPIKAHLEKYEDLTIVQIDAHSDLRDEYEGSKYSHACVMARVAELTKNIYQIGVRAQEKAEAKFIRENKIKTYYMRDIRRGKFGKKWFYNVVRNMSENVYITFDVDGLDPSVIPATGTPEPGGLFWDEALDFIKIIAKHKKIVGFDVVELAPSNIHPASNFTAAKLVYKILNYSFWKNKI